MQSFDFFPRTRIVFGAGKIDALGEIASEVGGRRALVVSDPGVIAAGHTARGLKALERAGIEAHLFDGVHENPTTADVEAGVKLARRIDPEILIGLGGGSSMDSDQNSGVIACLPCFSRELPAAPPSDGKRAARFDIPGGGGPPDAIW